VVPNELLQNAIKKHGYKCTTDLDEICKCYFYVAAILTHVDENNRPDLKPFWGANEIVGKVISKGDIMVYESTVYLAGS
jgi:UDP-N-acetyl-D-galactosamine dehydrogenase